MLVSTWNIMKELGLWTSALERARRARLKARKKKYSRRKFLLSIDGQISSPRESAAVHHPLMSLLSSSDEAERGDYNPAVEKTEETLSVAGSDVPVLKQEKEARIVGGIPSR